MTAAVVLVAVLAIGFAARAVGVPRSRTTSDLFTAIQPPGTALLATGLAAEHLTGAGLVNLFALGRARGAAGGWLVVALTTGVAALAVVAAGPVRRAGLAAPGDLARVRWADERLERWFHGAALATTVLLLVPVVQAAVLVVGEAAPVNELVGTTVVFTVILGAAVMFSGRGSLYAQQIRLMAMMTGLVAAGILVGRDRELPLLAALDESTTDLSDLGAVSYVVVVVLGSIAVPHLWPRLQAAATADSARRAVTAAGALVAVAGFAALAVAGAGTRTGEPMSLADEVLRGLVLAGVASGCLAAASSLVLTASVSARRIGLRSVRGAMTAAAGGAAVLARVAGDAGPLVTAGWGYGVAAGCLTPAVIAGLWSRSASAQGLRAGIAVGATASLASLSVIVVWWATGRGRPASTIAPALVAMAVAALVSVLTVVVVSRRFPDRSVEAQLRMLRPASRR